MSIKITKTFTDDHIECVGFLYNSQYFELMWCGGEFVGRLRMIEEDELTLKKALKKYPEFLAALNGDESLIDDKSENEITYQTDAGYLTLYVDGKSE